MPPTAGWWTSSRRRRTRRRTPCWQRVSRRWTRPGAAPFVGLEEKEKLAAVLAIEGSPFFEAMRAATARHLYDDRALWPRFGYEGASSHLGGYIERGFDDIDWISEEEAELDR